MSSRTCKTTGSKSSGVMLTRPNLLLWPFQRSLHSCVTWKQKNLFLNRVSQVGTLIFITQRWFVAHTSEPLLPLALSHIANHEQIVILKFAREYFSRGGFTASDSNSSLLPIAPISAFSRNPTPTFQAAQSWAETQRYITTHHPYSVII